MTCKCDRSTWTGEPGPICKNYSPVMYEFCTECGHDDACHKKQEPRKEKVKDESRNKT